MSAFEKEKILIELRQYHLDVGDESSTSEVINELKTEFVELEDKAISMMLGFANGKTEYVDLSDEVKAFQDKVIAQKKESDEDAADLDHFLSKIEQLKNILSIASKSSFKIRPPRFTRTPHPNTSRITITKNEQK
jgi:predicted  nucleic acid-binding Zn-ribbon protein